MPGASRIRKFEIVKIGERVEAFVSLEVRQSSHGLKVWRFSRSLKLANLKILKSKSLGI